jgi:hypothetical protein
MANIATGAPFAWGTFASAVPASAHSADFAKLPKLGWAKPASSMSVFKAQIFQFFIFPILAF